ncbi:hypothetical protein A9Q78_05775 [Methylophaga sp. 41_12_T18]|nr:hypothetical protein A9Q78_05775 [Methylophaga sp. 41_12_T18]
MQRIPDDANAMSFMMTQDKLIPFYWGRLAFGVLFSVGLIAYLASFFVGSKEAIATQNNGSALEQDEVAAEVCCGSCGSDSAKAS